jgi:hypothetical protein
MPAPTRRANNVLHHAIRCGIRIIVEEPCRALEKHRHDSSGLEQGANGRAVKT